MQGVGRADVLLYFKCPTTKQMRCPVNAYKIRTIRDSKIVSEWLVSLKADVVLLRENLQGKGPAYVFADAGGETRMTAAKTLSAAILGHNEQKHPPNGLKRK
jgi:hypothetical protein